MSNYLVSDSDLASVANAIRTKGGTSASLAFPADFVSAIGDIPSGGGTLETVYRAILEGKDIPNPLIVEGLTRLRAHALNSIPKEVTTIHIKDVLRTEYRSIASGGDDANYPRIVVIEGPVEIAGNELFNGAKCLVTADLLVNGGLRNYAFENASRITTIILRNTSVVPLMAQNVFNGSPFKNGGTGGTIYIPKVLYDALGTGVNDYKAASNWSTIDGYGTITWAKIEGSIYENTYADGTPIS